MKASSANGSPEAPSLQTARGLAATNLALPGFGSLMARRRVGWPQSVLTVVGFALTMFFGVRFAIWFFRNVDAIYGPEADPLETMLNVWLQVRWALLGMAMVAVSWLWALTTNAAILREARSAASEDKPPVLA